MSLDYSLIYEIDGNEIPVYDNNITHNLTGMADAAGVYYALWRPEERGYVKASDTIPVLEAGLAKLEAEPDTFRKLNPDNGWGSYEGFVRDVCQTLEACRRYPNAKIWVSR